MSLARIETLGTVIAAALAAAILVTFLIRRPPMDRGTVLWLVLGLGVFPIAAAMSGNVRGYEASKSVEFCSSCHVMKPWIADVTDPAGTHLASFHARNAMQGPEACYGCHEDYGMYGPVTTKLTGTKHLYAFFIGGWRKKTDEQATHEIQLYKPFPNSNCMHCHSTALPGWNDEPEHQPVADDVRSGNISCASAGCHGPAHGIGHGADLAAAGGE